MLIKKVAAFIAGALGCMVVLNTNAAEVLCGPRQDVILVLAQAGEKQVFRGIVKGSKSIVMGFASPKTNTWTLIFTADGDRACFIALGTDFEADRILADPT